MNRIILVGSIILMGLFSCSKEDDLDQQITPQKLVSPDLTAYVANTDQTTSPMTGFLEIYPCTEGKVLLFTSEITLKIKRQPLMPFIPSRMERFMPVITENFQSRKISTTWFTGVHR